MTESVSEVIKEHRYEIDTLKDGLRRMLSSLDELTKALNAQATQFAVFAEKHDTVSSELVDLKKEVKAHGNELAAMKPFIDSLRGLVWRIVGGSIVGGTGVAVLISAIQAI